MAKPLPLPPHILSLPHLAPTICPPQLHTLALPHFPGLPAWPPATVSAPSLPCQHNSGPSSSASASSSMAPALLQFGGWSPWLLQLDHAAAVVAAAAPAIAAWLGYVQSSHVLSVPGRQASLELQGKRWERSGDGGEETVRGRSIREAMAAALIPTPTPTGTSTPTSIPTPTWGQSWSCSSPLSPHCLVLESKMRSSSPPLPHMLNGENKLNRDLIK